MYKEWKSISNLGRDNLLTRTTGEVQKVNPIHLDRVVQVSHFSISHPCFTLRGVPSQVDFSCGAE